MHHIIKESLKSEEEKLQDQIRESDNDLIDDLLDKPGTIAKAKIHGQANLILNIPDIIPDNVEVEFCEDCNLPLECPGTVDKFDYAVNPKKLAIAGYGVYLYFFFINYVILNLSAIIVIACLPYIYLTQSYTNELVTYCTEFYNNKTTPTGFETDSPICIRYSNMKQSNVLSFEWANNWSSETMGHYRTLLSTLRGTDYKNELIVNFNVIAFITLLTLLIINILYTSLSTAIINEIDFNEESPSDYTLMISDIPKEIDIHNNKQAVLEYLSDDNSLIHEINFTYHLSKLKASKNELIELKKMKQMNKGKEKYMKGFLCCKKEYPMKDLKKEIYEKTKETNEYENETNHKFNGVGFVVFANQKDKEFYYKRFPHSFLRVLLTHFVSMIGLYMCCCCLSDKKKKKLKRISKITVSTAPEPSDVIWENLEYNFGQRMIRNFVANVVSLICIAISFGLVFLLNWAQDSKTQKETNIVLKYGFSFAISIVIQIINFIMSMIFTFLAVYEKPWSYTLYYLSLSVKQTFFTFLNTAIVPLACNIVEYGWENHDVLINNMLILFILDSILDPVLSLTCYDLLIIKFKQWLLERNNPDHNKEIPHKTQRELNSLYENPDMEISAKYSNLVASFLLACFYIPIFPFGSVIVIIGSILTYFVEKFKYLRIYKKPTMFDHTLCFFYIDYFVFALFVYGIGNWVFLAKSLRTHFYEYFNIIFYGLLCIIPYHRLLRSCDLSKSYENTNEIGYEDAYFSFQFDYERLNPKTQKQGVINYLRRLKDRFVITEAKFTQAVEHLKSINIMKLFHPTQPGGGRSRASKRSTVKKLTNGDNNVAHEINNQQFNINSFPSSMLMGRLGKSSIMGKSLFNSLSMNNNTLNIHNPDRQMNNIQDFFMSINFNPDTDNNKIVEEDEEEDLKNNNCDSYSKMNERGLSIGIPINNIIREQTMNVNLPKVEREANEGMILKLNYNIEDKDDIDVIN